jgi:hypothetical protein
MIVYLKMNAEFVCQMRCDDFFVFKSVKKSTVPFYFYFFVNKLLQMRIS